MPGFTVLLVVNFASCNRSTENERLVIKYLIYHLSNLTSTDQILTCLTLRIVRDNLDWNWDEKCALFSLRDSDFGALL